MSETAALDAGVDYSLIEKLIQSKSRTVLEHFVRTTNVPVIPEIGRIIQSFAANLFTNHIIAVSRIQSKPFYLIRINPQNPNIFEAVEENFLTQFQSPLDTSNRIAVLNDNSHHGDFVVAPVKLPSKIYYGFEVEYAVIDLHTKNIVHCVNMRDSRTFSDTVGDDHHIQCFLDHENVIIQGSLESVPHEILFKCNIFNRVLEPLCSDLSLDLNLNKHSKVLSLSDGNGVAVVNLRSSIFSDWLAVLDEPYDSFRRLGCDRETLVARGFEEGHKFMDSCYWNGEIVVAVTGHLADHSEHMVVAYDIQTQVWRQLGEKEMGFQMSEKGSILALMVCNGNLVCYHSVMYGYDLKELSVWDNEIGRWNGLLPRGDLLDDSIVKLIGK